MERSEEYFIDKGDGYSQCDRDILAGKLRIHEVPFFYRTKSLYIKAYDAIQESSVCNQTSALCSQNVFCHINSGIKNVSTIQLLFPKNTGSLLKILSVFFAW